MNNKRPAKKILFLAANPKGATYLRLDVEVREIEKALERAKRRDQFVLKQRGAVQVEDFQSLILNFNPQIVHFSGHGKEAEKALSEVCSRDITSSPEGQDSSSNSQDRMEGGVYFQDENGNPVLITGATLASVFKVLSDRVECVVLNSCYSEDLLKEIGQHIKYVIGMKQAIGDKAAIEFSRGFYSALGAGESIRTAFDLGRAQIQLSSLPEEQLKHLPEQQLEELSEDLSKNLPEHLKPEIEENEKIRDLPPPLPLPRCKFNRVAYSSLVIAALIVAARFFGILQSAELGFYDFLIRSWQREAGQDDRLLVVEVTQADVRAQEKRGEKMRDSLSNETLVKLLAKLDELNPRAVGLDIYREYPLNTNDKWDKLLKQRFDKPKLFAVCKVGKNGSEVPPPPGIPLERVGFSNFAVDSDNVLRRQLLAFDADKFFVDDNSDKKSDCGANFSFNLLLANHYLMNSKTDARKPIGFKAPLKTEEEDKYCQDLKFGDAVFPNFHAFTGGFQGKNEAFGCQVLLDYRRSPIAETTTVEDLLDGTFKPQKKHKDRIILIGIAQRDGIKDYHNTPYTADSGEQMSGVEVHAQKVSQILNTVSGERRLIWVLPQWRGIQWGEILWISGWAMIGGVLVWWSRASWSSTAVIIIVCGSSFIVCYFAFQIFSLWLPFVPSISVLLLTGIPVWYFTQSLHSDIRSKGS